MHLVHAFQFRSATSPEIVATRDDILRGFIPVAVAVATLYAADALAMPFTSVHVDPHHWLTLLLVTAIWSGFGLCCLRLVFTPAIGTGMIILWTVIIAGHGGLTLSYITSSLGQSFPLRDPILSRIDSSLGFHWTAMLLWFDRYPTMTAVGRYFYETLVAQQVIVPMVLILFQRYRTAQMSVVVFITSLLLTHLIAVFTPAVDSYEFYEIDPSQHPNARLSQENIFVPTIHALRSGATVSLDQPPFFGVTAFPSLHSTMAVVFAWTLREVPYVRWVGLFTNAMMLAFTPLHGSHYLVDVIAGVALACVAIPTSQWFMRTLAGSPARAS